MNDEYTTIEAIEILFDNFKSFLIEKNKRYGDSAINPAMIFSNVPADVQICNRLDDKLARIKQSDVLRKNDAADLLGYLVLLLIQHGWLTFDDLLD